MLAEHFDIKYFVKMKLANQVKWESKMKEDKGKFTCRLCGKSYGTRLGTFSKLFYGHKLFLLHYSNSLIFINGENSIKVVNITLMESVQRIQQLLFVVSVVKNFPSNS